MKCCDITSSKLRWSIQLQRQESAPDGIGGYEQAWVTYATPRAMIKPVSGRERMEYERLQATVAYRCVIRFRDDLSAADRVVYNGKTYNIRYFYDIEERRRFLEMTLEEGVPS